MKAPAHPGSGHPDDVFGDRKLAKRYSELTKRLPVGRQVEAMKWNGHMVMGTVEALYFGRNETFNVTVKSRSGIRFFVPVADVRVFRSIV